MKKQQPNKQQSAELAQMTDEELRQLLIEQTVMQLWQSEVDDCGRINDGEMSEAEAETRAAFWQQVGEMLIKRRRQMRATGAYIRRKSAKQAEWRAKHPTATVLPFSRSETPPVAGSLSENSL
jgi:hypothetical protein